MQWGLAGAVVLSGIVIVFAILVILILMVILAGRLSDMKPAGSAVQSDVPVAAVRPAAAAVQGGITEETVAVITAAVAATMEAGSPGTSYAVTSIRRQGAGRPVWGFAGMQQNTRPF